MKKTSRLLALLLALAMSFTMLAACGNIENKPPVNDDPAFTQDPAVSDTPSSDATDQTEPTTDPTSESTSESTTTEATTTEATTTQPTTTTEATTTEKPLPEYTVEEMEAIMYATLSLNVRSGPSTDYDKIDSLKEGEAVTVTGRASTGWYRVVIDGEVGFASNIYLSSEAPDTEVEEVPEENVPDDEETEEVPDVEEVPDDEDDKPVVTPDDDEPIPASDEWVAENNWEYVYDLLEKDAYRQVADEIMTGIADMKNYIRVSPLISRKESADFLNLIITMLPIKYCYVNTDKLSITRNDDYLTGVVVEYFVDTKAEAQVMMMEMEDKVEKVLKGLDDDMSSYEQILYIHDWIITNSTPNKHNYNPELGYEGNGGKYACSAYGAIVAGEPTCLGYAKALFYMLGEAGFDCTYAIGMGTEARHIWVKVNCDGRWYNIDPTWNDPIGSTQNDDPNYVCYDYFMVTDSFMKRTHADVFDMKFFEDPTCKYTAFNWHVMNDAYAESVEEAEEILEAQLKKAAKTGDKYAYARIKFKNEDDYTEFKAKHGSKYVRDEVLPDITSKYDEVKQLPNSKTWCLGFRIAK